ncbi:hypothetical protein LJC07_02785 [Christensenellaceae bacterium OttesenSCG-928-L17]|nr:hypothetical protein [Christensenellaceae bacterium OttesenSCG-928-L17]
MKKFFTLCLALLLLISATPAMAATVRITTQPATITSAGTATLQFTVVNDSATTMQDIKVSGYSITGTYSLGYPIAPADSLSFSIKNISVTDDMLGETLLYTFQWTEGGQSKSTTASITLGASSTPAPANMTASRTASKTAGKEGDKITLTYNLNNPGMVAMTDILIKDEGIVGASAIASSLSLEPLASRTVTYEYTLGKQDVISKPIITYKLNGQTQTLAVEELSIAVTNIHLLVTVTQSDPTTEGVLFTLVLKNDGNTTISNIAVTDELGNKVNEDTFTLQAGQEKTLSFLVSAETLRNIMFTIKGTDAQGQAYQDMTRSYEVLPYVDESSIVFSIAAAQVQPLNEAGRMTIRFTIQNDSRVDLTDAILTEEKLDVVEHIGALARGETVIEKEIYVGEPRELSFTLTATDPSGTARSKYANMTAALVDPSTPLPEESTPPVDENPEQSGGRNILVTILIVLASLMALAGIALIILSIYERKRNASMQEFDLEDDDDDGFPPAPVHKAQRESERTPPRSKRAPEEPAPPRSKQAQSGRTSSSSDDSRRTYERPAPRSTGEYTRPSYTPRASRPQPTWEEAPASPQPPAEHTPPASEAPPVYVPGSTLRTNEPSPEDFAQTQRIYVPASHKQPPPPPEPEPAAEELPTDPPQPTASAAARNRVHRVRPSGDEK